MDNDNDNDNRMIMDHGDGARVVMVPAKGGIGASADGASGGGASADGASADGAGDGDDRSW